MIPGLDELPAPLREAAAAAWSALDDPPSPEVLPAAARVLACSPFVADACAADPGLLHALVERGWEQAMTRADYDRLLGQRLAGDDAGIEPELRKFRRDETVRIAWRDLAGLASLEENLEELSALADACIAAAYDRAERELVGRFGMPRAADGRAQRMVVLALGKLGAGELNFSSDVDLIFAYPENGETDGEKGVSNEEFFTRLGRKLIGHLDTVTADGFVYRVDMRLRPFGEAGALALSFNAAESYYQEHGRDWERYALIKARPVAGDPQDGVRLLGLLRPFIYRRYLDFASFEQLRRMKGMIRQEVKRRELADNFKLGRGGIREIEFIGQAYQLIRGGREPVLQERRILRVLELLGRHRHLSAGAVEALTDCYTWLRRLENRLQAQHDRQVHELPGEPLARARLALAMDCDGWEALESRFSEMRDRVNGHFEAVFAGPRSREGDDGSVASAMAGFSEPERVRERLAGLRESTWYQSLGDAGRERLDQLLPRVLDAARSHERPEETVLRMLRILEAIGRRISYLSLLIERPAALDHLARLCSASTMIAERVAKSPLLLDELLDPRIFTETPDRAGFERELGYMFEGIAEDDLERQMDTLRAFQQAAVLRVAVADVVGLLPVMRVSDYLTDIAEICLEKSLQLAWGQLVARHGEPRCGRGAARRDTGFCIIGYGKLGGIELGYGSDLDLVFLHDSEGESQETEGGKPVDNAVFFARLGQRVVHILSTPTPAGVLYEVDTRLRPSGASGLLVSSLSAFSEYQREEAWTWEHQALLRARAVAGSRGVAVAFDSVRGEVLARPRDDGELRREVAGMRARMRNELAERAEGRFDLKQGRGGIADIEFLVQYLVLKHAHARPALLRWTDNIRQLETLVEHGVLERGPGDRLADAYRALRERVHKLVLQGEQALVDDGEFTGERELVASLWNEHLGEEQV